MLLTALAVVIATIISGVFAGLWFTLVIPRYYAVALGRENAETPPSTALSNFGPVVCMLITVNTSAVLIHWLDITSTGPAMLFGLLVGVGYLTAMTFQIAINPNFPKPLLYGVINAPFFIVSSVLSSVVIALFN